MTASKELETVFRDARRQVDSWDTWQRSLDPHSATVITISCAAEASEHRQEKIREEVVEESR